MASTKKTTATVAKGAFVQSMVQSVFQYCSREPCIEVSVRCSHAVCNGCMWAWSIWGWGMYVLMHYAYWCVNAGRESLHGSCYAMYVKHACYRWNSKLLVWQAQPLTNCSTGCIARAGDVIHPVLRLVRGRACLHQAMPGQIHAGIIKCGGGGGGGGGGVPPWICPCYVENIVWFARLPAAGCLGETYVWYPPPPQQQHYLFNGSQWQI